jgi:AAA domain
MAKMRQTHVEVEVEAEPVEAPVAVPFLDYLDHAPNPKDTLLGNRFLCREGGMLAVGPSGIGKSSMGVQMDVCWSVGRPAFGIEPAGPLKILVIQAENDAGDLHEMIKGVMGAMRFSKHELDLCRENLLVIGEKARTAKDFVDHVLAPSLDRYRSDMVRIDPMLAYLGGDPSDPKVLSPFCRNWINPVLQEFQCACVLNHHTPKTNNRDTSNWKPSDWMYSGAGSADLTNWARAVLVIEPTANPDAFRLIAAKRGRRTGWVDELGQPVYQRIYCHTEGSIAWREATPEEVAGVRSKKEAAMPTDEALMAHVPITGTVPKDVLLAKWNGMGMGVHKCSAKLKVLLSDNPPRLFEHLQKRSRTRPQVLISRHEETLL